MASNPVYGGARNFHFGGDEDQLGVPSGAVGRIRANLAAMWLLRHLEREGRGATPREQVVLARWSGWGAVSQALDSAKADEHRAGVEKPDAQTYYSRLGANRWFEEWGRHHWNVRRSLNAEEWNAARNMTVDAFYTPSTVVRQVWAAVRRLGFTGGRVLEPGAGSGNFLTFAPTDLAARCRFHAVEMDHLSARLLRHLHPRAQVSAADFTTAELPTEAYDLVIGNVPFGPTPVPDLTMPLSFNTHNYFFAKASRLLAPGGLCCLLTSRFTLDAYAQANARQRQWLAEQFDLVGAVRFPMGTFNRVAGTDAMEDLLFLRRKDPNRPLPEGQTHHWDLTHKVDLPDESSFRAKPAPAMVNEYFVTNPDAVLGTQKLGRGMNGNGQYMVVDNPAAGSVADRLAGLVAALPENIYVPRSRGVTAGRGNPRSLPVRGNGVAFTLGEGEGTDVGVDDDFLAPDDRALPGEYVERRGSVWQVEGRRLVAPSWRGRARAERLAGDYVALKELVRRQIALESVIGGGNAEEIEQHRPRLREAFARLTARHGNPRSEPDPLRVVADDPCIDLVRELQTVIPSRREDGSIAKRYEPAAILTQRVIAPNLEPDRAESPEDAVRLSMAYRTRLDLDYIASLLRVDANDPGALDALRARLRRVEDVYEEPGTGRLLSPPEFFAGNLRAKLRACQAAERTAADHGEEGRFGRHIARLEEMMPPWEPFESITASLGARWVPTDLYGQFLTELLGAPNAPVAVHLTEANTFTVRAHSEVIHGSRNTTIHAGPTGSWRALDIAEAMLHLKPLRVMVPHPTEEKKFVLDPKKTEELQVAGDKLAGEWQAFLERHPEARERVENAYNETLNNEMRVSPMEGQAAIFPGMNAAIKLRPAQRSGIAKNLRKLCGMNAHDTGYGKTITELGTAGEARRLGLARKPVIGTLNDTHEQFCETARKLYPGARILAFNQATDGTAAGRRRFLTRAALGDWDIVLIPHSQLALIPNQPQTVQRYFDGMLSSMDAAISDAKARGEDRSSVKAVVRMRKSLEAMLKGVLGKLEAKQGKEVFWEECGFDLFILDEAHIAKRAPFQTAMQVKGLDTSFSLRGLSILLKNISIQEKRHGRGVIYATATPLSNTLAEFWNIARQCEPNRLDEAGLQFFDNFASTYCQEVSAPELNEANNTWRVVSRLARYKNVRSLQSMLRAIFDVRMDPKEAGLKLPATRGGKVRNLLIPCIPEVQRLQEHMARAYTTWERSACRAEMPHVPLVLMGYGMSLGIDPRLVDPTLPRDLPGTLARAAVKEVARMRRENLGQNGMVLVCVDRFRPMRTRTVDSLDSLATNQTAFTAEAEEVAAGVNGETSPVPSDPEPEDATETEEDGEGVVWDEGAETAADAAGEEGTPDSQVGHGFNLVHHMMDLLAEEEGIPRRQIGSLLDAKNGKERKSLLDRCQGNGDLAVMFISSGKGGVGINVSERCCGLVEIGPPKDLTPKSAKQVRGRIIRDPNRFEEVEHIRMAMEGTVIAGHYHRIQRKEESIVQIMTGTECDQQMEDPVSELSLAASEMKALILQDDRILRQTELKDQVRRLEADVRAHATRRRQLADSLRFAGYQQEREELTLELLTAARPRVEEALGRHRNAEGKKLLPTVTFHDENGRPGKVSEERVEAWLEKTFDRLCHVSTLRDGRPAGDLLEVGGLPVRVEARGGTLYSTIELGLLANQDGPAKTRGRVLLNGRPTTGKGALQIWFGFKAALDVEIGQQTRRVSNGRADIVRLTAQVDDDRLHPKAGELTRLQEELAQITADLSREGKAGNVPAEEAPGEVPVEDLSDAQDPAETVPAPPVATAGVRR